MPVGLQVLEAVRVNAIMQTLQDQRELPQQLKFLRRTAVVPALDSEIMARFTGRIQIADLVADDSKAVTYQTGKLSFETNTVPNIKHGTSLTQEQIQQLFNLTQGGGLPADQGLFTQFENRTIDGLRTGILQRMEALIVAMQIDGLSYDRLGIRMLNVTWGMPADLKVTPAVPWTDSANATPVTDVLTLKRLAQVRYGQVFDRLSMSLTAFLTMIATTEFQTKARAFIPPQLSYAQVPQQNTEFMKGLAQNVLEVAEIEINDERYWSQDESGALTSAPYQPINKIIFSNRADDNNPEVMDFANGVVTESLVSAMMPSSMVGRLNGPQRGPVAYATAPPDLNPPNLTYWGVARGFPRKRMLQATAVMTIGTLTDTIPVGEPF